jgi:hydroxyacylglutathione hydrolase
MIFRPYYTFETGCAGYLFGCGGLGKCAVVDRHERDVDAYLVRGRQGDAHHPRLRHARARRSPLGRARAGREGRAQRTACTLGRRRPGLRTGCTDGSRSSWATCACACCTRPGTRPRACASSSPTCAAAPTRGSCSPATRSSWAPSGGPTSRARTGERRRAARQRPRQAPHAARRVEVYPAHFAGSACGAGMSGKPSSTIAFRATVEPAAGARRATPSSMRSPRCRPSQPRWSAILPFNRGRAPAT